MSDLIERLRGTKWLNDPFPAVFWDLTREAADEIERLTAERDTAEAVLEILQNKWASRDLKIEELTARADANADHAKLANENRAFAAAALKASQARVAELEGALALQCNFLRKIKSYANSNTTYDIEIAEMSDTALQRIEQALKGDT